MEPPAVSAEQVQQYADLLDWHVHALHTSGSYVHTLAICVSNDDAVFLPAVELWITTERAKRSGILMLRSQDVFAITIRQHHRLGMSSEYVHADIGGDPFRLAGFGDRQSITPVIGSVRDGAEMFAVVKAATEGRTFNMRMYTVVVCTDFTPELPMPEGWARVGIGVMEAVIRAQNDLLIAEGKDLDKRIEEVNAKLTALKQARHVNMKKHEAFIFMKKL